MFQAGWGKERIAIEARGYAMHGFGQPHHRAHGIETPLWARALCLQDDAGQLVVFCCLDLGYVTWAMRSALTASLREAIGDSFADERFVLTCTHTHSGPGGCSHDAMYNLVTPGFQPAHLAAVISAAEAAIAAAWQGLAPTDISIGDATFEEKVPVAWNRSLDAWNRNPDVVKFIAGENHRALDRRMQVLRFAREGKTQALLSLFGVHATCVSNHLDKHDGDNKGYAASAAEAVLAAAGAEAPVAIFAQSTAGDVSPHYHGPSDLAIRRHIQGNDEYAYAKTNGEYQSSLALAATTGSPLGGSLDGILTYVDFSNVTADPAWTGGVENARTGDPCHGVAFVAGTPVDGPGVAAPLAAILRQGSRLLRRWRMSRFSGLSANDRAYYQALYEAHGEKDIVFEAGRKLALGRPFKSLGAASVVDPLLAELHRQAKVGALNKSAMVPTVLPLQIIRIGTVALVCCPGEFTTTAGRRLLKSVEENLQGQGYAQVLICTYCNEYMGYVTTREEYQQQAYEGGHTIFGQWTLAAFQTQFAELAREFCQPAHARQHNQTLRPAPAPADELAKRSRQRPNC